MTVPGVTRLASAQTLQVYRTMAVDLDDRTRPAIGPEDLGVRVPPSVPDVKPIPLPDGVVGAGPKEGMSVFDDPWQLPINLRPASLAGRSERPVWVFPLVKLPNTLVYRQTRGSHGVIAPAHPVCLHDYVDALVSTATGWSIAYE